MVTNASPGDIAEAIGLTVPAFFSDAFDQFVAGEGGYLATGEPKGAIAQIGQEVGRAACRRYGSGNSGATGRAAARYERACRPYLDTLQPSDGLGLQQPLSPGRCDGQIYSITFDFQTINTDGSLAPVQQTTRFALGPIYGIRGAGSPAFQRVETINGREPEGLISGNCAQGCYANINLISVVPAFGATENCVTAPPIVVGPPPIADPTPPPFRFNPLPGVDVQVEVGINPDGSITFDVGTGDVTVNPFDNSGGAGGLTPSDLAPGGGEAGGAALSGDGGEAAGEAGPGEELVGVNVEVLQTSENVNRFDNVAATVYRGIGYVRMGYPGRLGIDISGGTVLAPQFFHAQQRGLTAWAVRANNGFELRITPYYREITE